MKIAIMQPSYLPWCGYFALIEESDCFVLLDDVAFQKQSWQQRNQIVNHKGLQWLTVPVTSQGLGTEIREIAISNPRFGERHWRTLDHCYRRAPHFAECAGKVKSVLKSEETSLFQLNANLLSVLCKALQIETPIRRASDLGAGGKRGEHVAAICEKLGADEYLSPLGAADYLHQDAHHFRRRNITVSVQQFEHPVYHQGRGDFYSHASVVDLLFHTGSEAGELIRAGRRPSLPLHELAIESTKKVSA